MHTHFWVTVVNWIVSLQRVMTVLSWVIATALLCFVSVDALYESEVGTFDW